MRLVHLISTRVDNPIDLVERLLLVFLFSSLFDVNNKQVDVSCFTKLSHTTAFNATTINNNGNDGGISPWNHTMDPSIIDC